jgi:Xaa-Pro aminopeptidase
MWTPEQIKYHKEAAKRLLEIKDLAFEHIRRNKNISELELQIFILEKFKEYDLKMADQPQIVAFGANSAMPHYHPTEKSNRILKRGDVIKIDIWAKVNRKGAPFADITWMGFGGRRPSQKINKIFNIVIAARNKGIKFIKSKLRKKEVPLGKEVDRIVRDYIHQRDYGDKFIHGTGHSLGLYGPHGNKSRLRKSGHRALHKNVAYTIEPGIYLSGQFGIRSEIDFYITDNYKFILTTNLQKKIIEV